MPNSAAVKNDKSLGEQHAADEAHGQGKQPHEHRLVQHDARHMARRHAQHQVGAELPLAAADEELVGVQNEEAQHAGHHHGEHAQDVGGGIEHAARGRGFHIEEDLLAADGVERVEHRHTEQQRDEVDGVVAHRSADVAQGELKIHGRLPAEERHDLHDASEERVAALIAPTQLVEHGAVLDKQHAAGVAGGEGVVGDHHDGGAHLGVHHLHDLQHHRGGTGIEGAGGLVG